MFILGCKYMGKLCEPLCSLCLCGEVIEAEALPQRHREHRGSQRDQPK